MTIALINIFKINTFVKQQTWVKYNMCGWCRGLINHTPRFESILTKMCTHFFMTQPSCRPSSLCNRWQMILEDQILVFQNKLWYSEKLVFYCVLIVQAQFTGVTDGHEKRSTQPKISMYWLDFTPC